MSIFRKKTEESRGPRISSKKPSGAVRMRFAPKGTTRYSHKEMVETETHPRREEFKRKVGRVTERVSGEIVKKRIYVGKQKPPREKYIDREGTEREGGYVKGVRHYTYRKPSRVVKSLGSKRRKKPHYAPVMTRDKSGKFKKKKGGKKQKRNRPHRRRRGGDSGGDSFGGDDFFTSYGQAPIDILGGF